MFEVFDDVSKGNYERGESDMNLPPLMEIKGRSRPMYLFVFLLAL